MSSISGRGHKRKARVSFMEIMYMYFLCDFQVTQLHPNVCTRSFLQLLPRLATPGSYPSPVDDLDEVPGSSASALYRQVLSCCKMILKVKVMVFGSLELRTGTCKMRCHMQARTSHLTAGYEHMNPLGLNRWHTRSSKLLSPLGLRTQCLLPA